MTRHDSTAAPVMLLTWATILVLGPLGAWDVRAQPVKMAPVAEGTIIPSSCRLRPTTPRCSECDRCTPTDP
jgi:hypothetical protein